MLLGIPLSSASTTSSSPLVFPRSCCLHSFAGSHTALCRKGNLLLRRCAQAVAVFCDQYHPKTRLPGHHLCVCRRRLVEWDRFDHGGHAAQGTETERSVTSCRVARQRARYLALPEYEIHARGDPGTNREMLLAGQYSSGSIVGNPEAIGQLTLF